MNDLFSQFYSISIAIGPVIGYILQYKLIKKRRTLGSFSINLCGALLFCNILRVEFYLFKKYELALLFQSIFMLIMQYYLLKLCVAILKQEDEKGGNFQKAIYDELNFDLTSNFWKWNNFSKYQWVIFIFTVSTTSIAIVFSEFEITIVGEFIGYLSLISQSVIMLPQIIQNQKQKRVKGISRILIIGNNLGDIGKLIFFIIRNQPQQFLICGVIQIILDGYLIFQIFYFGNGGKPNQEGISNELPKIVHDGENKPPTEEIIIQEQNKLPEGYGQFQDQVS